MLCTPLITAASAASWPVSCATRRGGGKKKGKLEVQELRRSSGGGGGFGVKKKEQVWSCVSGCGACCKLDKGPSFATPEEIFDNPSDVEFYRSLIGPDGWCKNYHKPTRTCSIYPDRPYFCRVEPKVFHDLYGISAKFFNREACCFCRDTIKEIYGPSSDELKNFNSNLTSL